MNRNRATRTFEDVQRSRKRASMALFALLILFYFMAFLLLWVFTKMILFLWMRPLAASPFLGSKDILLCGLLAAGAAAAHWYEALSSGVERILSSLSAATLDPKDRYHRVLVNVVEEMKIASGAGKVEVMVIPIMAVNAFTVTDLSGRSVIGITEGLVSRMSRRQLQAVVAHEMSHIREGDGVIVTMACSLFGVFSQMLTTAADAARKDGRVDIILPLLWLITLGAYLLNVMVSRQREYLADAVAVELTRDPVALAEALYKMGRRWRGEGFVADGLAPIFAVNPSVSRLDESEGFLADLFSTHPPLRKRILALLGLAHTGMSVLVKRVDEEEQVIRSAPRAAESALRSAPAPSPRELWIAYRNGEWNGPYTPDELMSQPWVQPQTWVARAGSKRIVPAKEIGEFLERFVAQAAPAAGGRRCPACMVPLRDREYEGIMVLECPHCNGILLERGQDYRVLNREEETFPDRIREEAGQLLSRNFLRPKKKEVTEQCQPTYACPMCGRAMRRQLYNYQYFVEVDRCSSCGLTWFDGDELEILQVLVEKAKRGIYRLLPEDTGDRTGT